MYRVRWIVPQSFVVREESNLTEVWGSWICLNLDKLRSVRCCWIWVNVRGWDYCKIVQDIWLLAVRGARNWELRNLRGIIIYTRLHEVVYWGRVECGLTTRDRDRVSCHWAVFNDQIKRLRLHLVVGTVCGERSCDHTLERDGVSAKISGINRVDFEFPVWSSKSGARGNVGACRWENPCIGREGVDNVSLSAMGCAAWIQVKLRKGYYFFTCPKEVFKGIFRVIRIWVDQDDRLSCLRAVLHF